MGDAARNALFDAIVHSQDIAVALSRDFPVAVEPTGTALALLMLLTGRDRIVLDALHGPGLAGIAA